MKLIKLFSMLSLFISQISMAQTCYDADLVATTPSSRFVQSDNGTVEDQLTGLMWMRCSIGQTYNSTTKACDNEAQQVTWQQALKTAKSTTFADFSDWHLPDYKQLASIVERQCVDPAVNAVLFPNTLAENYWSSTSSIDKADHAWAYAFYSGKNNLKNKNADVYLRLVRFAK
ncbi:DUF1566 domain-containing protein [Pseudoalteromonas denitrificans]|uniref:Lcl C-terminal domain-containing protein n=1 Tax=Pseudoalteromonas denitrificans DSM 6059 TaxID=1123010 RepID=A0A1I1L5Y1_9GAMM|nr:DUF1566 domain-containing protein [Pseudoalteromonas denitrificans]SFC68355.1 Protein of unknown function [Pseudoalteromonas denitrificans DSM 6059]